MFVKFEVRICLNVSVFVRDPRVSHLRTDRHRHTKVKTLYRPVFIHWRRRKSSVNFRGGGQYIFARKICMIDKMLEFYTILARKISELLLYLSEI